MTNYKLNKIFLEQYYKGVIEKRTMKLRYPIDSSYFKMIKTKR